MPDGVPVKGKRVAIYQCAEDGIADTIKPRLQQAGADCERVAYIIDNDIALTLEDGRIETAIKGTHASVFIIDPRLPKRPTGIWRKYTVTRANPAHRKNGVQSSNECWKMRRRRKWI